MEIHINLRARLFVSQYLFVTQYLRNSIFFQLLAQEYQPRISTSFNAISRTFITIGKFAYIIKHRNVENRDFAA